MAFWSSQTLEKKLHQLIDTPTEVVVDCNAIELRVGEEAYITPDIDKVRSTTKLRLSEKGCFSIPPGQFAFLLTEEVVTVPPSAMAFISMKATFKMKGLVNVSGFHVDPGWRGRLIYAVFNAGPSPIHLQRGLPLFLIWYASLDEESEKRKGRPGPMTIPPATITDLAGGNDSLYALEKRLREAVEELQTEDKDLRELIHNLRNSHTRIRTTFAVLSTIAVGVVLFAVRESFSSTIHQAPSSHQALVPECSTGIGRQRSDKIQEGGALERAPQEPPIERNCIPLPLAPSDSKAAESAIYAPS